MKIKKTITVDSEVSEYLKSKPNISLYINNLIKDDMNKDENTSLNEQFKQFRYTLNALYTLNQVQTSLHSSSPYWKDERYIIAKKTIDDSKRINKDKMKGIKKYE